MISLKNRDYGVGSPACIHLPALKPNAIWILIGLLSFMPIQSNFVFLGNQIEIFSGAGSRNKYRLTQSSFVRFFLMIQLVKPRLIGLFDLPVSVGFTTIYIYIYSQTNVTLPNQLGLENTPTAFLPRGESPPTECPGYDTKQSAGEVPVIQDLWGMRSTPSLSSLPCPLRPGVVAPDRVVSMGQIELNCVLMLN